MNIAWLSTICSRLRIFISYPSEHYAIADEIAQCLRNEGHEVFFDKDSLPPAEEYNERIRTAIRLADRCIFLIARNSTEPGRYMLTEIDFAKARWPVPAGRVLPVLVDPSLKPSALPVYLRSVNAITPKGSIAAETAAAVDRMRRVNRACWTYLAIGSACILFTIAATALFFLWRPPLIADIAVLPIEKIHFRPRAAPPSDLLAPGAWTGWIDSPLTITVMSMTYTRRDQSKVAASLVRESMEVNIRARAESYVWAYVVDIKREEGCADDWLCRRANVGAINLLGGHTAEPRETMFIARSNNAPAWRNFIDPVIADPALVKILVKVRSDLEVSDGTAQQRSLESICEIDVASARSEFLRYFKPAENPRPAFWQPNCARSSAAN